MYRLKMDIRGYVALEVIAATPDLVREQATQIIHQQGKKRGWDKQEIQGEIDKVEGNNMVIEDLTSGAILVDYEPAWL